MRLASIAAAVAVLVATPAHAADAPAKPALSVVQCGHLIDVDAGKLLGESTIVIEGKRIKEVRSGYVKVEGAHDLVAMPTSTCLPGLIDSHVHLTMQFGRTIYSDRFRWNEADYAIRSTVYAKRTLEAGFTTVRNLGDNDYDSVSLRNAINADIIPGPRIFTAGVYIGSTGGHADDTDGYRLNLQGDPGPKDGIINSPEDAWKAVRQH
jgi:imidazolonepropionase-like amidohydrolase